MRLGELLVSRIAVFGVCCCLAEGFLPPPADARGAMTALDNSKSKPEGATFAFSSGEERANRNRPQLTRPLSPCKITHLTFSNRYIIAFSKVLSFRFPSALDRCTLAFYSPAGDPTRVVTLLALRSPKVSGPNVSHPGGSPRPNPMKTKPEMFSTRHTYGICVPRVTCPPEIESRCSDFENLRPARIMSDAKLNARASEEGAWPQR
jgi:hypothetical protein